MKSRLIVITAIAGAIASVLHPRESGAETAVDASNLPRLGTVDLRYQSYNVEMVEVTGGRFWKPYAIARQSSQSRQDRKREPSFIE